MASKRKATPKQTGAAASFLSPRLQEPPPANGAIAAGSALRAREKATVEGGLISVDGDGILGWAWDPADPTRAVTAVVTSGDVVIGTGIADLFDHDSVRHHVGPGIPGFLIKPTRASQGRYPVALTLKDEAGPILGAPLSVDDPAKLEPFSSSSSAAPMRAMSTSSATGF